MAKLGRKVVTMKRKGKARLREENQTGTHKVKCKNRKCRKVSRVHVENSWEAFSLVNCKQPIECPCCNQETAYLKEAN